LKTDSGRLLEVLGAVDAMSGRWGQAEFFKTLKLRLTYGVRGDLVELVQLPNVGKARAEKLQKNGVKNLDDFLKLEPGQLKKIMGVSEAKVQECLLEARRIRMT